MNDGLAGGSVGDVAAARGLDPFDALLDVVIADELRTGLRPPMPEPTEADWKLRAEAWLDDRTIVGGSDAGAHLDMMCGAVYSTSLLASVRDHHTVTWEEAVRQLTDVPASFYGLKGRGRLASGFAADITIFDPATVGAEAERTLDDLPGGVAHLGRRPGRGTGVGERHHGGRFRAPHGRHPRLGVAIGTRHGDRAGARATTGLENLYASGSRG